MANRVWNPATGKYEDEVYTGAPVPGVAVAPYEDQYSMPATAPLVFDLEPIEKQSPANAAPDTALERALATPDDVAASDLKVGHAPGPASPAQAVAANRAAAAAGTTPAAMGAPGAGGKQAQLVDVTPADVASMQPKPAEPAPSAAPQFPALAAEPAPPIDPGLTVQTSRTKQSALALQGQKEGMAAAQGAVGLAERQGALNEKSAEANAKAVANESAIHEQQRQIEAQGRLDLKNRLDAANAERDRILADAEKKSQADYWSDKPAGARVISMFTSAVGAYLAVRNGGPNVMQDQLDKLISRDDAKKQQELQYQIKKHGMRGEAAQKAFEYGTMELSLRKAAVYDQLADLRANALAAKGVDQATIDKDVLINHANQASAGLKEGYGEKANVHIQTSNALQQQARMQAAQQAAGPSANLQEREKGEAAAAAAATMDRAQKFIAQHPEAYKQYQEALKAQAEANALQKTKVGAEVYNSAQFFGAANTAMEQRLNSPAAKEIHSLMTNVVTAKARQLDPVGALNQSSVDAGRDALGLMTRGAKELGGEIGAFRDQKLAESRAAVGSTGYIPPSANGMPGFERPNTTTRAELAQLVATLGAAAKGGNKAAADKLIQVKAAYPEVFGAKK